MNHSTPGLPVHHQLLDFTQTHVYRVGDAIQPSHPLPSASPPAPNIFTNIDKCNYIYTLILYNAILMNLFILTVFLMDF